MFPSSIDHQDNDYLPSPKSSITSSPLTFAELPTESRLSTLAPLGSSTINRRLALLSPFPPIVGIPDSSTEHNNMPPTSTTSTTALFLRHTSSSQLRVQTRQTDTSRAKLSVTSSRLHYATSPTSATENQKASIRDPSPARSVQSIHRSVPSTPTGAPEISTAPAPSSRTTRPRRSGAATFAHPTSSSSPKIVKRLTNHPSGLPGSHSNRRVPLSTESTRESVSSSTSSFRTNTTASAKKQPIRPPLLKRSPTVESRFSPSCQANGFMRSRLHNGSERSHSVATSSPSKSPKRTFAKSPNRSFAKSPKDSPATSTIHRPSSSGFNSGTRKSTNSVTSHVDNASDSTATNQVLLPAETPTVVVDASLPFSPAMLPTESEAHQHEMVPHQPVGESNVNQDATDLRNGDQVVSQQQTEPPRHLSLNIKSLRTSLEVFHFDSSRSQDTRRTTGMGKYCEGHVDGDEKLIEGNNNEAQISNNIHEDSMLKREVNDTSGDHGVEHVDGELKEYCNAGDITADLLKRWRCETDYFKNEMRSLTDELVDRLRQAAHNEQRVMTDAKMLGTNQIMKHPDCPILEEALTSTINEAVIKAVELVVVPEIKSVVSSTIESIWEGKKQTEQNNIEKIDQLTRTVEQLLKEQQQFMMHQQFMAQQQQSQVSMQSQMKALHQNSQQAQTSMRTSTPPREKALPGSRISSSSFTGKLMGSGRRTERSGGRGGGPSTPSAMRQFDTPCSWALSDSMALSESRMTLGVSAMSNRGGFYGYDRGSSRMEQGMEYPVMGVQQEGNCQLPNSSSIKAVNEHMDRGGRRDGVVAIDLKMTDSVGRDVMRYESEGLFNENRYQTLLSYDNHDNVGIENDESVRHAKGDFRGYPSNRRHYDHHHNIDHDEFLDVSTPTNHRISGHRSPQSAPSLRQPNEAFLTSIEMSLDDSVLDLTGADFNGCVIDQRSGRRLLPYQRRSSIYQRESDRVIDEVEGGQLDPLSLSASNNNENRLTVSELEVSELEISKLGTIPEVDSSQDSDTSAFQSRQSHQQWPSSGQQPSHSSTSSQRTKNQPYRYQQQAANRIRSDGDDLGSHDFRSNNHNSATSNGTNNGNSSNRDVDVNGIHHKDFRYQQQYGHKVNGSNCHSPDHDYCIDIAHRELSGNTIVIDNDQDDHINSNDAENKPQRFLTDSSLSSSVPIPLPRTAPQSEDEKDEDISPIH